MAITRVQGVGENSGTSATFSSTVASGDAVCVFFGYSSGSPSSVADDKGNTYTIIGTATDSGYSVGVAYQTNITNGPKTITVSGVSGAFVIIDEFGGVSTFDTSHYANTGSNSPTLPSGNISPAQNGELLYAAGWAVNSPTVSIGSPWLSLDYGGTYSNVLSAWQVQATAASVQANYIPGNGSDAGASFILAFTSSLTTVTTRALGVIEAQTTARVDSINQIDLSFEIRSGVVEDTLTPVEVVATGTTSQISDRYTPIENLIAARGDATLRSEWLSAALRDTNKPTEAISRLQRDAGALSEDLAGAVGDTNTVAASGSTQVADAKPPIESSGAVAVTRDQSANVEVMGGLKGEAGSAIETGQTQRTDANAAREALGIRRSDSDVGTEALATALCAAQFPAEWRGALSVIADALFRLGITEQLRIDATERLESDTATVTLANHDSKALLEILNSVGGRLRVSLELLQAARADANLITEMPMRVTSDLDLPSESIGRPSTFLDVFLALEATSQCRVAAALGGEALFSAQADKNTAVEAWITPLSQIAVGRLLKSPGRRRLLTS